MAYLHWQEKKILDENDSVIENHYNQGFVFTRGKGIMHQTRSIRIDLHRFTLSSENRRILKKFPSLTLKCEPIPYDNYSWEIGKMGKDFYEARSALFSANKIKELITDKDKTNFNKLLQFENNGTIAGYCIILETQKIIHYSYPFYGNESKDVGLAMMLQAILWAQNHNKKYIYLGSLQRPNDTYKLQFSGTEWFNGKEWNQSAEKAKEILRAI